jgi:cysteine synthase A
MHIIDSDFGATGIALAYVAADRGYDLTLTMPETVEEDLRNVLTALGVGVILTSAGEGEKGAVRRVEEIASAEPQLYFIPRKFSSAVSMTSRSSSGKATGTITVSLSETVAASGTIPRISRYTQHINRRSVSPG